MPAGYYNQTFQNCKALETIAVLRFNKTTLVANAFDNCDALVTLMIEGTIGQSGLNLQWSTALSRASIESVVAALDMAASGKSVTFSEAAVDVAFTAEEWAALAAEKPNWTINLM